MRRTFWLIAALLIAATLTPVARAEVSDQDLEQARQRREQVQTDLNKAAAMYSQALTAVESTKNEIARTEVEVADRESRFDALRVVVEHRAVAAYKGERSGQFGSLFGSKNMNDLVDRVAYLERATNSDSQAIGELRVAATDLRDRRTDLARLQAQQENDVSRADAVQRDLEDKLSQAKGDEQGLLAERAREDEARRQAEAAAARQRAADAARQAEATRQAQAASAAQAAATASAGSSDGTTATTDQAGDTDALGAHSAPSGDVEAGPAGATALGNFVCPVAGAVAFSDDFGAPRSGHTHQGNDMFASQGTPVVATRSGTASLQSGGAGGNMVFLYGGGDYFMYAHLDSFTVDDGQSVSAGQQLGTVGDTGDATAYHLHFEIHPGGGSAVDPYPTISAAC
jgi:murein DD-endopeptidase MepM/ murein hydrolase activator NlpD